MWKITAYIKAVFEQVLLAAYLDFDFQRLLDGLQLDDALLLLMHLLDDLLQIDLDLLVTLVADAQLLGHLLVVGSDNRQFLFQLGLERHQVHVDSAQLVDACGCLLVLELHGALGTIGAIQMGAHLLQLTIEAGQTTLGNAILIESGLQLALDIFVVGLQFSQLQRLLLDHLLQVDVGLVGHIQRHLQLGDLDLQLLLDACHLGLQPGLSLNDASIQLLDLNAGLLAKGIT